MAIMWVIYMEWNHAGKLKQVNVNYSSYPRFAYSPMGQRQKKQTGGFGAQYYIHDAQGNVLAVYSSSMVMYNISLHVTQQYIYGSSRLGAYNRNQQVFPTVLPPFPFTLSNAFTRGQKHYELSNHLGNVNSVISDRKLQTSTDGIYVPDVKSFTDYYPFGYQMENRSWAQNTYRYGFNGQEKDNEIYGVGNSTTAEFWQYDTRLGRRWNLEPLAREYPWISPYATFMNNPMRFIDPTGMYAESESGNPDNPIANSTPPPNPSTPASKYQFDDIPSYVNSLWNLISDGFTDLFFNEITPPSAPDAPAEIVPTSFLLPKQFPSYVGFTLSGDAIVGGGGGLDLTLGYIKGDGFFVNGALRMGMGFDISASANFSFGWYTGSETPTAISLSGLSFYQGFGAGFLNIGGFQDVSNIKPGVTEVGQNWVGGSVGVGFGSKTYYGGSAGTSLTTQPWFKF